VKIRGTEELPEVLVVEPVVLRDERGFFLETYHARKYREGGLDATFVQDNHSLSGAKILRGLHAQLEPAQGKLVRVVEGEILDVAVDIRKGSPTFARWTGVRLSDENFLACYLPPGFAHGFCVLSDRAQVEYKCTALYEPRGEIAIRWNDPEIGVDWPVSDPQLSAKDREAPFLREVLDRLPDYRAASG
jgi:dTDP-4-dehydrorhamnose 3,5-epimerase